MSLADVLFKALDIQIKMKAIYHKRGKIFFEYILLRYMHVQIIRVRDKKEILFNVMNYFSKCIDIFYYFLLRLSSSSFFFCFVLFCSLPFSFPHFISVPLNMQYAYTYYTCINRVKKDNELTVKKDIALSKTSFILYSMYFVYVKI